MVIPEKNYPILLLFQKGIFKHPKSLTFFNFDYQPLTKMEFIFVALNKSVIFS